MGSAQYHMSVLGAQMLKISVNEAKSLAACRAKFKMKLVERIGVAPLIMPTDSLALLVVSIVDRPHQLGRTDTVNTEPILSFHYDLQSPGRLAWRSENSRIRRAKLLGRSSDLDLRFGED
jgi:hypothetical protein